jgi:hypothetical protein
MKILKTKFLILLILFLILTTAIIFLLFQNSKKQEIELKLDLPKIMKIKSSAFENNSYIPSKYTCDGENINPPLEILDIPEGTQSLVLIVDDPDAPAGTFLHWLIWNISPDTSLIEEKSLPPGAIQGRNDFGRKNYGGPCPPSGTHRYFFKVYALNKKLDLPEGSSLNQVQEAIKDQILDQAQLIGLYQRK